MVSEGFKSVCAQKFSSNYKIWTAERNVRYLSMLHASGQWHFLTRHPHWTASQSQCVSSIPWCLSLEKLNKPLVKVANVARKQEIVGNTPVLSNSWDASGHVVHLHKAVQNNTSFQWCLTPEEQLLDALCGQWQEFPNGMCTHEQATVLSPSMSLWELRHSLCLGTNSCRHLHFGVVALSYILPLVSCI